MKRPLTWYGTYGIALLFFLLCTRTIETAFDPYAARIDDSDEFISNWVTPYERKISGESTVKWSRYDVATYGAMGDRETDDTEAIQTAIDEAEIAGGGIVFLPQGRYKITSALVNDEGGVFIVGVSKSATQIWQDGTDGENCIEVSCSKHPSHQMRSGIRDLSLYGNASSGNGLDVSDGYNYHIQRVASLGHGSNGYNISGYVYYLTMLDCEGRNNYGHGCYINKSAIYGPNANFMYKCTFIKNDWNGLHVEENDGLDIFGGSFESNGHYGIKCVRANAVSLWGGWIESNGTLGIFCPTTSYGCVFRPNRLLQPSQVFGSNRLTITPRSPHLGGIYESTLNNYLSASILANQHSPHGNQLILPAVHAVDGGGDEAVKSDNRSMLQNCVELASQNDLITFGHSFWTSPKCLRNGIYKATVYAKSYLGNSENLQLECKNSANATGRLLARLSVSSGDEFLPYVGGIWTITDSVNYDQSIMIRLKKMHNDSDSIFVSHITLAPIAENEIMLLSSKVISLSANADTPVFTVPTGYRCILNHAKFVAGFDAGKSHISIGQAGSETDFLGPINLDGLNAQYDWVVLAPIPSDTPVAMKSYEANTVIEARVEKQAGGENNTLYLYGSLYR